MISQGSFRLSSKRPAGTGLEQANIADTSRNRLGTDLEQANLRDCRQNGKMPGTDLDQINLDSRRNGKREQARSRLEQANLARQHRGAAIAVLPYFGVLCLWRSYMAGNLRGTSHHAFAQQRGSRKAARRDL